MPLCIMRVLGLALVLGLAMATLTSAEIFSLDGVEVPGRLSLRVVHAFYAYAEDPVPFLHGEPARVFFRGPWLEPSKEQAEATKSLAGAGSVQVILVPYADFFHVVGHRRFCCSSDDVTSGRCSAEGRLLLNLPLDQQSPQDEEPSVTRAQVDKLLAVQRRHNNSSFSNSKEKHAALVASELTKRAESSGIFSHTVQVPSQAPGEPWRRRHVLRRSGVYVLAVSNCGSTEVTGATLRGEVILRNPFGFLPGNVWPMVPLLVLLVTAHAIMALAWCVKLLLWRGALFAIQRLLSCVLGMACFAAFAQLSFCWSWNTSGTRGMFASILTPALVALAKLSTWVLLLTASLGWGLTRPQLSRPLRIKLLAFSALYLATHVGTLEGEGISRWPAVWLFGQVLDVSVVCSIFCALCHVMRTLREQQLHDRLLMFQRLRCVLVICLLVALVAASLEVVLLVWVRSVGWKWAWIGPAVSQLLTLTMHACMVYLWAPNKYSQSDRQPTVALLPADTAAAPELDMERLESQEMVEPAPSNQQDEMTKGDRQQCFEMKEPTPCIEQGGSNAEEQG